MESRHLDATHRGRLEQVGVWLLVAGGLYVVSWLVGLFVAPASPSSTAPAAEVQAYYAEHSGAVLAQSLTVHGLAGLCLLAVAILLGRVVRASGGRNVPITGSGAAAAAVSLVQAGLAVGATTDASSTAAGTSRALFRAINYADTVKLFLLAAFIASTIAGLRQAEMAPRWLRGLGYVSFPLLVLGGLSFVVKSNVLDAVLAVSLLCLLAWVGGTAVVVWRHTRAARSTARTDAPHGR